MTSGDGISACWVCQSPPLDEALGTLPASPPGAGDVVIGADPAGETCRRLEKMALSYTGEVPRRPVFGKPGL